MLQHVRFLLLTVLICATSPTPSFSQNFDANTQITIESLAPASRPSQTERQDEDTEPPTIRSKVKDLPPFQRQQRLEALRKQSPFQTLSKRDTEEELEKVVEVPNPKAGQKKSSPPVTTLQLIAATGVSYDSNIRKARVNSLSDQIAVFNTVARIRVPIDEKQFLLIVGAVSGFRYSTYKNRDLDALGFSTAYGYTVHAHKIYPNININTTHTIQIGTETQAVFGTGFEPWSGTRYTPFVSWAIESIPLDRETCGSAKNLYCLSASVKFTYQENMLTTAFQDNSAVKMESTIAWITKKPGLTFTLTGAVTPRKFHDALGGREDVIYELTPGFEWNFHDNVALTGAFKYTRAVSNPGTFDWSGFTAAPQIRLMKRF